MVISNFQWSDFIFIFFIFTSVYVYLFGVINEESKKETTLTWEDIQ